MKYNFSKKQVIKNSLLAFIYSFIISLFLIAAISNLYENILLEVVAAFVLSLAFALIYSMVNYILYLRKTFSIDANGITFYVKDKALKTVLFKDLVETHISKSVIYGNNRVISLTTEQESLSFSVNYKVYERIRDFFPIFNDRKDESLIHFSAKYKLKTLLMQYCVIIFYAAVFLMIISPIMLGLLKRYSEFYRESARLYTLLCLGIISFVLLGYTIYFFYKFFSYSRHTLRFDGTLKLEYYKFNKQKCNNEIKNIIGLKQTKSVFSFLFNLEQVYIIWKNDRDIVQNDFVPFCLTREDVKKLKNVLFEEEEKLEPIKKVTACHSVFTLLIFSFIFIALSFLFSPWFLMGFLLVIPCLISNYKTRGSFVGESILALSNGVLTKRTYIFKLQQVQGITVTDRFFETKTPYASYEVYIEGYSGVYVMGVYERELEQKITKKLQDK